MELQETFNAPQGYFTIKVYDKNDKLIQKYEDPNQIMTRVPFNFLSMSYGGGRRGIGTPDGLSPEWPQDVKLSDFVIDCIALGTDGIDENEDPKALTPDMDMLFSEIRLWDGWANNTNTNSPDDMNKYIYQTHFDTSHATGDILEPATKINEGPSFPWDTVNNIPTYYSMDSNNPSSGGQNEATSMTVKSKNQDVIIDYEFVLGQYAGNGIWEKAVAFTEAGMYLRYDPIHLSDDSGIQNKPLGALFSMKTFPKVYKTEACWLKIHWTVVFGNSEADIIIITDDTTTSNFRAVLTPFYCGTNDGNLIETTAGYCEI